MSTQEIEKPESKKSSKKSMTLPQLVKIRTLESRKRLLRLEQIQFKVRIFSVFFHFLQYFFVFHEMRSTVFLSSKFLELDANKDAPYFKELLIQHIRNAQALAILNTDSKVTLDGFTVEMLSQKMRAMYRPNIFSNVIEGLGKFSPTWLPLFFELIAGCAGVVSYFALKKCSFYLSKTTKNQEENIKIKQNLNHKMAEALIAQLTKDVDSINDQSIESISNLALLVVAFFFAINLFTESNNLKSAIVFFAEFLICFLIPMTPAFIFGFCSLIQAAGDECQLRIKEKKDALSQIFPEEIRRVVCFDTWSGLNDQEGYISITFSEIVYKNQKILGHQLCRIVKKVLDSNCIAVVEYKANVIIFSLYPGLDLKILKAVENKILSALDSYLNIKSFTKQVRRIMDLFNMNGHHQPRVREGKNSRVFYYELNNRFTDTDLQKLTELFPDTCRGDNNVLEISSHKPCSFKKMVNLFPIEPTRETYVRQDKPPLMIELNNKENVEREVQKLSLEKKKREKTRPPQQKTSQIPTPIIAHAKCILWPSGTYNSEDAHCSVKILTGSGLPADKFYCISKLTAEDFSVLPGAWKKFEPMFNFPHLANSRRGAQGIVFIDPEEVKTPDGDRFIAHAKLKLKQHFGDARVFFEEEKSPDGEVLYVAKGFNPHAHSF